MENKMSAKTKKSLYVVFLIIFLDLMGFSIIFPLFPSIAGHYLEVDSQNFFLKSIFSFIEFFATPSLGGNKLVLFGGILGALYSFLQFIAAPIWGRYSDKHGRRGILLISTLGMVISYIIWIFSGSFSLLILSRIIGGTMSGNMSTATAVVADVTTPAQRSKGMAIIGVAFALGFILGPAIGGISSLFKFDAYFPYLVSWGINPFSAAALISLIFSFSALLIVYFKFEETLDSSREKSTHIRSSNPFKLFKPFLIREVNIINLCYFVFIFAFSGMEFTLTFLAQERLAYKAMDNAYMFIYIGLLLTLIQGGFVRRYAHQIGEKKLATFGMAIILPGLLIISMAYSSLSLYMGLTFLAIGSALIIPTLTSLVSLLSPENVQGEAMGIFRSLGSLGRVLGPFIVSVVYWRFSSQSAYYFGSVIILITFVTLLKLKIQKN